MTRQGRAPKPQAGDADLGGLSLTKQRQVRTMLILLVAASVAYFVLAQLGVLPDLPSRYPMPRAS